MYKNLEINASDFNGEPAQLGDREDVGGGRGGQVHVQLPGERRLQRAHSHRVGLRLGQRLGVFNLGLSGNFNFALSFAFAVRAFLLGSAASAAELRTGARSASPCATAPIPASSLWQLPPPGKINCLSHWFLVVPNLKIAAPSRQVSFTSATFSVTQACTFLYSLAVLPGRH